METLKETSLKIIEKLGEVSKDNGYIVILVKNIDGIVYTQISSNLTEDLMQDIVIQEAKTFTRKKN